MALRDQPYLPLYVQDFLTDEKLIECSAQSTGVYVRLMCIMHKSEEYGKILLKQKDKQSTEPIINFAQKIARQMPYPFDIVVSSLKELVSEHVLSVDGDSLCQKRMIRDNLLSLSRAEAGRKGGKFAQAKVKANNKANTEIENEIENKVLNTDKVSIKPYSRSDYYDEPEQAFDEIKADQLFVERLVRIMHQRGFRAFTPVHMLHALRDFLIKEGAKPEFPDRERVEVKSHFTNWISKYSETVAQTYGRI